MGYDVAVKVGSKQIRRLSDNWTQVTRDGKPSAHFEHTVALTNDGPWILTKGDKYDTEIQG